MTDRAEKESNAGATLRIHVPLTIRKRGGRRRIVAPAKSDGSQPSKPRNHDPLLTALARAYRWQQLFESGAYSTISELAEAEGVDRSYAGKVMKLMLLAPDLVEAILDGADATSFTMERLMLPFPENWHLQRLAASEASAKATRRNP